MKRLAIPRENGTVFMIDIEQDSATDNEIPTSHQVIYELYLENKRLKEVHLPDVRGKVCQRCKGHGWLYYRLEKVKCRVCNGTGKITC